MDRALIINEEDINEKNFFLLLKKAEELKLRYPELIDGWYIAGLCYKYKQLRTEALYNLIKAYSIDDNEKILSQIHSLNSTPEKFDSISFKYFLKYNNDLFLNIMVFIFTIAFLYLVV